MRPSPRGCARGDYRTARAGAETGSLAGRALTRFASARNQHADLLAVDAVAVAELRDQVALLEPDADQDVPRGADREQQVSRAHVRRAPDAEHETEVDRMPHVAVQARRAELLRRDLASQQPREHLAQPEQLRSAE